jgi:hypothetical protein
MTRLARSNAAALLERLREYLLLRVVVVQFGDVATTVANLAALRAEIDVALHRLRLLLGRVQ